MKLSIFVLICCAILVGSHCCLKAQSGYSARQIKDLNPGTGGSYPSNLTAFGTAVLFDANTVATGTELWKYDGSDVTLAADINDTTVETGQGGVAGNGSSPNWLKEFAGSLYFSAWDQRHGAELWRYDGTSAMRVTDINFDANDTVKTTPNSAWPSNLTLFDNAIYFAANNNSTKLNYELWKFDGNAASLVSNIHPDTGTNYSSFPTGLTAFNGALYFMADDGVNGYELWKYDGAKSSLLTNINPGGASSSSFPNSFTVLQSQLYFQAVDQAHGYELWKTDGTNATVIDINQGSAGSFPQFLTAFNGALYFRATDGIHGYELWKYDGSAASQVADLNAAGDSYPKNLIVFGNALYFSADDGVHGWELWKYDGTNARLVSDLNPQGDSFPENFKVFNGALYFSATTPDTGYELWNSDGETIVLVADINPGPGDSYPRDFTPLGSQLVFTAAGDGASDWELWAMQRVVSAQPVITGVSLNSGVLQITVQGVDGANIALEKTADFIAWREADAVMAASGTVTFSEPVTESLSFFRIKVK
jgi:ELWxxDGT repeat protein